MGTYRFFTKRGSANAFGAGLALEKRLLRQTKKEDLQARLAPEKER
jgi:hypothetical protein